MPGDNAIVLVDLDKAVALAVGSLFAILEGGRTVGSSARGANNKVAHRAVGLHMDSRRRRKAEG